MINTPNQTLSIVNVSNTMQVSFDMAKDNGLEKIENEKMVWYRALEGLEGL